MKTLQFGYALFFVFLAASTCSGPTPPPPIGINLARYSEYSPEFLFKDAFKSCREWITFNADGSGPGDTFVDIPLRDDGYPVQIPYDDGVHPPQAVRTLIFWDLPHGHPAGAYTLLSEGIGSIRIRQQEGGATAIVPSPANYVFNSNGRGGIIIDILESDADNEVCNIRFVPNAFLADYESQPFQPQLLEFLETFQCIRWMNLMVTNGWEPPGASHSTGSLVTRWEERNRPNYYSQSLANGVAYEYLAHLCNATGKDAWVNIPEKADDSFIRQFAILLQEQLDPELKIYVEYSNEVWNGIFGQHHYAARQGNSLGYPEPAWEQAWRYTAKRSADVFAIFESVFDDDSRLVKVLPAQAHSPGASVASVIITTFEDPAYNSHGVTADALAIAPYFGNRVAGEIGAAGLINTISIDAILDRAAASLPDANARVAEHKALADAHGLQLLAYEGGQHLAPAGPYRNDTALGRKLNEANRHPRMWDLYCDYLQQWYDNGGGLFLHYSSHTRYSQAGSFGLKEYLDQPLEEAPKYGAVMECAAGD